VGLPRAVRPNPRAVVVRGHHGHQHRWRWFPRRSRACHHAWYRFRRVLANLPPDVLIACTAVGCALAGAYTDVALPGGTRGSLVFTSYRRP
jgi:hypothetical protein